MGIVIFFAGYICSFTGNPLKFYTVKKQVYSYLGNKYKGTKFNISDTSYNFKSGSYVIEVTDNEDNENFNVNVSSRGNIKDYYIETKYETYIRGKICELFDNKYKNFKASVNVILPDNYKYNKKELSMNDISNFKVLVNVNWVKGNITKDSFVKACKSINDILMEHSICVDSCFYSCENKEGTYSMSIFKNKGYGIYSTMTYDEILKTGLVNYYRH